MVYQEYTQFSDSYADSRGLQCFLREKDYRSQIQSVSPDISGHDDFSQPRMIEACPLQGNGAAAC